MFARDIAKRISHLFFISNIWYQIIYLCFEWSITFLVQCSYKYMIYAPLVLHQSQGHNYEKMSLLRCLLIDNYSIQFEKRDRERERERERERDAHRDRWYETLWMREPWCTKRHMPMEKHGIYMLCNGTINIKHMEMNYWRKSFEILSQNIDSAFKHFFLGIFC